MANMPDMHFITLFELRGIPQRNRHYMILRGDKRAAAEELVTLGMVVKNESHRDEDGVFWEAGYRLNKPGREALQAEWIRRGMPKLDDIDPRGSTGRDT